MKIRENPRFRQKAEVYIMKKYITQKRTLLVFAILVLVCVPQRAVYAQGPSFTSSNATRTVPENTAAGENIGDPIPAEPGTVYEYRLVGTDASHFTLEDIGIGLGISDNGSVDSQLRTKGALDYETKNSYSVTLQLFTGNIVMVGTPPVPSVTWNASPADTISITINVENKNEAPAFSSSTTTIQIPESTSANADISSPITATDPDIAGGNTDANPETADADTVAYSLSGTTAAPNDYESFAINAETGQLKVAENVDLDYDDQNSYTFIVTASDDTLSGTIEVTVELQDVVHAPLFINDMGETITEASFEIREELPPGTDVGYALKVRVDDDNATVTYSLSAHDDAPNDSNSFTLNSDGQLKIADNVLLDYETKTAYKVNVTASDGTHSTTIPVTITVTNLGLRIINENGSELSSPTTVHVDEGVPRGTKIAGPYRINEHNAVIFNFFGVNNNNDYQSFVLEKSSNEDAERVWYIIAKDALDYESKNQYLVEMFPQVVGHDESEKIRLIINIRDTNDNRPVFTDGVRATRSIVENTPSGEPVGEPIAAMDDDAGTTITYALQAHPDAPSDVDAFTIDTGTGQIKTNAALDYETKTVYLVTVTATDDDPNDPNDTFRTTSIPVTINVTDLVPTFIEADPASRSVAENTARGTDIGDPVAATGPDPGETSTYSLVMDTDTSPDYDWFDIDPATGQLKTKGPLNYETDTSYTVMVAVSVNDNTEPSDTITVNISVTNVSNEQIAGAQFREGSATTRSVKENQPGGTLVGIPVEAINIDATHSYLLAIHNDHDQFNLDSIAQLSTERPLNFESKSSYSVTITLRSYDGIQYTDEETIAVTINLTNVNEAPRFADAAAVRTVPTTASDGTPLGAPLTAVDPDITSSNDDANPETADSDSLTYTLSGTHAMLFELDSEEPGQLIAKRPSALTAGTTYSVTVTASDGEFSDTIDVNITATGMPTVLITLPTDEQGDTIPQTGTFDVGIRFSEAVTGFAASDITLTLTLTEGSGTATAALVDASAGDMDYTARISLPNNAEGSLAISVPAGVATNEKSVGNTASAEYTVPIDTKHPTVTLSRDYSTVTVTGSYFFDVTFSEDVVGFTGSDFNVSNVTVTGSGRKYTAVIKPTSSANVVVVFVLENKVRDAAGNGNTQSNRRALQISLGKPNVTITAPTDSQSAPFNIAVTFTEIVEGFTASDISLGGTATGIVTNFMGDGINYTATVTPSTAGDLEISVPANVVIDDSDNGNNASSTHTVPVTVTGPTVVITGVPTTPQNSAFTITITFSETVTGFTASDISLGDNVSATVKSFSGSGTTYTAEIEPADNVEEDVTISVPTGVALNASSVGNNTSPGYTVRLDRVGPSVTITGPPETAAATIFGMAFDVTFEFHETVTEFDVDDISLGGNATATVGNFMTVSGTTYTATITPTTEGFVLVTAQANTAEDAAGNRNAATSNRFSVDPTRPVVTITDLPTAVQTGAFEGTFGFDDAVTGFAADDITLSGTVNATVTLSETSSAVYKVTITPEEDAEGDVIISVAENVAENAAGLGNTALATAVTVPVDTLHPEVRIKNVPAMATMGGFVVTFEFTQAVSGFEASDISLSGTATATVNNFTTESNRKYTANIIPSTTGNLKISVPADSAVDAANNGNIASSTHTVTITDLDTTPPTVSVTARSAVLDNPQNENFDVAITFSEPVIGFNAGDISLTLELTEGTGTATTDIRAVTRYIAVIKPPDDVEGVIKISVPAGAAKDASNNDNTASNVLTVRVDRKAPNVETIGVPTTPQNSAFDVKITFDEPVSGFTVDDISLTTTLTEGTGTATVSLSGDDGDSEYTLTITPPAEVEGEINISVPANAVVDAANNGNTVSSEYTALIDTIRPTTMITDLPFANDPQNGAFNVRIEFSEPVTGLEKTDIALTVNNVNATVTAVTETTDMGMSMDPVESGTAYIATITPTGQSAGKVSVRVPENVAEDAAGNGNEASLSSHDVTVDTKPPGIDTITVPTAANGAFDVTITFTDDVTDFDDLTDIVFDDDSAASATVTSITGSGKTYTATITPTGNGDLIFQVPADAAKDTAGNGNEASDAYTVLIDTTSPQVSTFTVPNAAGGAFNVAITFSEDVTDFDDLTDIVFGGDSTATATVTSITGSGTSYTATITPTGNGNLIVQVPAGAAKDTAGNGNTASGTHTVTISLTGPSVAITDVPTTPQNSAFDVKITFSESVTEFVASDISLGTGVSATVSLTGSGAEYTATITPASSTEEDITLSVPAGVAKNSSNMTNTASSEYAIRLDTADPLLTIRDAPANAGGAFIVIATFDIEIKFNETVTGVEKDDITFSGTASAGASVTDLTGEGSEYTATIKVTTAGNLTISVRGNAADDTAGNGSRALPAGFRPTVQVVLIPLGFDDAASDTTRTIAENPNEGMNIGDALSATDADDDTLAYNLSPHDDDTNDYLSFTIDIMTGQLKARNQAQYPLNYEVQSSYKIKVEVTDDSNTNTASINVTVNITDVNEAPFFPETTDTTLEIEENTAGDTNIGDPVAATDPDGTDVNPEDDNVDALTYSLVDATDPNADAAAFAIDSGTGQLKTKNPLDYETKNEYRVTVKASDGALEAEIDVTISIIDVEVEPTNNAPTFPATETGTRSIAENTDAGRNIGAAVSADDMDTGDNLTYSLKAHTDDADDFQSFDIVSTSGQLKTKTGVTLDYETQSTYKVTVQVSDGTDTASIDVTISITNVNEAPAFATATATRSIAENTDTGTNIGAAVTATDPDGTTDVNPENVNVNKLTYSLVNLTGSMDADAFDIDSNSGQIKTKDALNYEVKNSYTFNVQVSDGAETDAITVTITVTNVTMEPPVFTAATLKAVEEPFKIAENTAADANIGTPVTATDDDGDTITYALGLLAITDDYLSFAIDSETGQIKTKESLDYETQSEYSVDVSATTTNEVLGVSVNVTIQVTDVNEKPVFAATETGNRSIAENTAANTNIGDPVAATDPDTADDDADNTDVNPTDDNVDALTYSLVNPTSSTDADAFAIESTTGQIKTKNALDHETKGSYAFKVRVSDGEFNTDIDVTITVTDVDETPVPPPNNAPTFPATETGDRSIAENTATNTNIGTAVSADDLDTGDTLTYSLVNLTNSMDADAFAIDSTDGQLKTKSALNYEEKNSYTFKVQVSDGTDTASIDVTISITNVNEAPAFPADTTTSFNISESATGGTVIGTVAAEDPDVAGTNTDANPDTATADTLTYSLKAHTDDADDYQAFTIENTANGGQLKLKTGSTLDYETQSTYKVTVEVSDGSKTDSIDVTISVTNVNEAPVFPADTTTSFNISESAAGGTVIGTVAAEDPDIAGTNTDANPDTATADTLTYSLKAHADDADDFQAFDIVSTSGQLKTKASVTLDYETQSTYKITVQVSDGTATASIDVTVNVTNVNEAPVFPADTTTSFNISESAAGGTAIGTVAAEDPDITGTNTDANPDTATADALSYSLGGTTAAPNDYQSFTIENTANGGQLKLKTGTTLDYETQSTYKVTVEVSDGSKTDSIDVTISVTNVNEAPVFPADTTTSFNISESAAGGTVIGTVAAEDPDIAGTNTDANPDTATADTLTYSLKAHADDADDFQAFDIVSTSGQLKTKASVTLDYETQSTYKITVQVSDGTATASIDVTVNVTNVNEAPVFPADTTTSFNISESAAGGTAIGTVAAEDPDITGTNTDANPDTATADALSYSLGGTTAAPNDYQSFTIENTANGGQLKLKTGTTLDYDTKSAYTVKVTASDGSTNTASIDITINVLEIASVSITAASAVTNNPQNGAFNVTITFSGSVTGFAASDISLTTTLSTGTGSATVSNLTGSGTTYTATITPPANVEGTVKISVPAGAAVDSNSQGNAASSEFSVAIDTKAPGVRITNVPTTTQNSAFTVTITFGESVTGFAASDITLGGTATASATISGSGTTYTATITPTGSGNLTIQVPAAVAKDSANNNNTASGTHNVTISLTGPSVAITDVPTTPQNSAFNVTITFGEAVTGFTASDITLTTTLSTGTGNATVTSLALVTGSDTQYTATITPPANVEGTVKISVPAGVAHNTANTGNAASSEYTIQLDTAQPSVRITNVPTTTQNSAFTVTITFGESVTGFAASDITLGGTATASVTRLTGSGTTYIATITPTTNGSVSIQVPAGAAEDAAGNGNTQSQSHSVTFTTETPPVATTLEIVSGDGQFGRMDRWLSSSLVVVVKDQHGTPFQDAMVNFSVSPSGRLSRSRMMTGSNGQAEIRLKLGSTAGTYTVTASVPGITDTVTFTAATVAATTVEIYSGNGQTMPAGSMLPNALSVLVKDQNGDPFEGATVDFSVNPTDGTLDPTSATTRSNGRAFTTLRLGSTAEIYTVTATVRGITDTATFTATATSVGYNAIKIVSGNGQSGRAGQQLPRPLVVEVKNQNGDPLVGVTVRFSTAFDPDTGRSFGSVNPTTDTTDADGQASTRFMLGSTASVYTVTASATIINVSYSVTFTANVIGTVDRKNYSLGKVTSDPINIHYGESVDITVRVSPYPIRDASASYLNFWIGSFAGSGALNTNPTGLSITSDDTDHKANIETGLATATVAVASDAYIPDLEPNVPGKSFRVMVAFLVDNVNGTRFLSDGTSEGISPDPISFTVRVTEPQTLQANVVEDNSGEVQGGQPQAVVSAVETVEVDTDSPGVSISVPSGVQTGAFEVTVTFTEAVTGFAREDLSVTGTANAIITAWVSYPDNTTYTAMITPTTSGQVVLNIAAGVATDAANNPNTASETQTITIEIPEPSTVNVVEDNSGEVQGGQPQTVVSEVETVEVDTDSETQTITIEIPPPIPEPSTWMPNANLRTAVQTSLSLAAGETLTQAKMLDLTELRAAGRSISDITGIEHATNLTTARLANNQISSLSPLSNLTTLTRLRLQNNQISDVSALSGLTNLTQLFLNDNDIRNITPLSGLVNLETLRLSENPLTNNDANAQTLITLQAAGATIDVPVGNVGGAPTLEKETQLPATLIPKTSALLPNFPNPFNPETWIPYQLAQPADVSLTIYNMRGVVVREIKLGHQAAGLYRSRSRAIHWDGRNIFGERVASGVYFYTFTTGDFTATRRMLIRK